MGGWGSYLLHAKILGIPQLVSWVSGTNSQEFNCNCWILVVMTSTRPQHLLSWLHNSTLNNMTDRTPSRLFINLTSSRLQHLSTWLQKDFDFCQNDFEDFDICQHVMTSKRLRHLSTWLRQDFDIYQHDSIKTSTFLSTWLHQDFNIYQHDNKLT